MEIQLTDFFKNRDIRFWFGSLVLVVILASILITYWPLPVSGMIGSVFLMVILLLNPGWTLIFLLLYIWLIAGRTDPGDLLEEYPIIRWGSYILIPVFTFLATLRVSARGYWQKGLIEPFIVLVALILLFSGFTNETELTSIIFSIGIYLRYPILFLLLVNFGLKHKDYLQGLKLFIIISLFLCMEAIICYSFWGKEGDETFFTLGVSHGHVIGGLFFIYFFCFIIAHSLKAKVKYYNFLSIVLISVGAWIAGIRAFVFAAPVSLILLFLINQNYLRGWRVLMIAVISLGMVMGANFVPWHDIAFRLDIFEVFNPGYRFDTNRIVFETLLSSDKYLLGWGPRSISPGTIGPPGLMFELLTNLYGTKFFPTPSQLITTISEMGFIGFFIYWVMLLLILRMNLKFWESLNQNLMKQDGTQERVWRIVSLAFMGIWFNYAILMVWVYDVWRIDLSSFIFWGCAAAIYSEKCRRGI